VAEKKKWSLGTAALHAGYSPIPMDMTAFRSFVPPIIQSALYPLSDIDHYTRIVDGEEPGYDYGRNSNPTVDVLQKRLAALEGGEAALATPSGMHACFVVTRHLTKVGDEVVTSHRIFGEAYDMFFRMAPERMGITPRLVQNPEDLGEWERLITPRTRYLWAETPSNPTLFVTDIAGLADMAHAHGLPLIVDNTLATPMLQHPLELGADIVVHSLTKFMTGNGTIVGGSVVGKKGLIREMVSTIACVGSILSPFDAWLALLSLETLPIRMARHSSISHCARISPTGAGQATDAGRLWRSTLVCGRWRQGGRCQGNKRLPSDFHRPQLWDKPHHRHAPRYAYPLQHEARGAGSGGDLRWSDPPVGWP